MLDTQRYDSCCLIRWPILLLNSTEFPYFYLHFMIKTFKGSSRFIQHFSHTLPFLNRLCQTMFNINEIRLSAITISHCLSALILGLQQSRPARIRPWHVFISTLSTAWQITIILKKENIAWFVCPVFLLQRLSGSIHGSYVILHFMLTHPLLYADLIIWLFLSSPF